jgi:tRNA dimethylallyltransferase
MVKMNKNYNIITICGPTASGKTSLAVKLALEFNGEIISGDSRQVFRGMDIGTGKDLNEYTTPEGNVPFHLIDIALPSDEYSLYRYLEDFEPAYNSIVSKGHIPFLTGGSGLYIEAALRGYSLPDAPINENLRRDMENLSKEELKLILENESEEIFRKTDKSSTRRIIRGIEIARYMKSEFLINKNIKKSLNPLIIGINPPREVLLKRIEKRLNDRLEEGMIQEVEVLLSSGISYERLIKLGLEYRYCALYLRGDITIEIMKEKLNIAINRFSKRQMTWFRGMERRGLEIHWLNLPSPEEARKIITGNYPPL